MQIRVESSWLSAQRYQPYIQASPGEDLDVASRLYEWNAAVSAALFEVIHHFEVLLRNAIVHQLEARGPSALLAPGVPWIRGVGLIEAAERQITKQKKQVTPGRIYARLSFGFWRTMFSASNENEELWRHSLSGVFHYGRAERATISRYLESINSLRNTIAHHGSLIELDTHIECQKIIRLASWIDPQAGDWIRSIERVSELSELRPVTPPRNVVVVPAAKAWPLYDTRNQYAYVFQAGRSIRLVDRLAFYADQEIKPVVPVIKKRYDAVDWNTANAKRLDKSNDTDDRTLAKLIRASKKMGWNSSIYQVFLLSGPDDQPELRSAISHSSRGRGSAFTQGHRYLRFSELESAVDTGDLRVMR